MGEGNWEMWWEKIRRGERARVEGEQVLRVPNEWLGIRNLE